MKIGFRAFLLALLLVLPGVAACSGDKAPEAPLSSPEVSVTSPQAEAASPNGGMTIEDDSLAGTGTCGPAPPIPMDEEVEGGEEDSMTREEAARWEEEIKKDPLYPDQFSGSAQAAEEYEAAKIEEDLDSESGTDE